MGVDSGLPDYRSPEGFWNAYPPLQKMNLSLEDISHPEWFASLLIVDFLLSYFRFEKDPWAAWGFYAHRALLYQQATPHDGFQLLKYITKLKRNNYYIFTSNIDGQFQKAGFDEDRIYECHGSLQWLQCINCDDYVWQIDSADFPQINEVRRTCIFIVDELE